VTGIMRTCRLAPTATRLKTLRVSDMSVASSNAKAWPREELLLCVCLCVAYCRKFMHHGSAYLKLTSDNCHFSRKSGGDRKIWFDGLNSASYEFRLDSKTKQ
jgi:hypothetical protein